MSNNKEFIRVVSSDGFEFYLDKMVAFLCPYFEERLRKIDKSLFVDIAEIHVPEVRGEILEIIIQYLHYKSKYCKYPSQEVPPFPIKPELALEVLNAAICIKI
jgi:transcription elongation factor B subunit 1